jgi:hypothetical protein
MKQRGNAIMESAYEVIRNAMHLDELADLDAWEGYEFWSAQLDAEADFLTDLEHTRGAEPNYLEQRERKIDVLPF